MERPFRKVGAFLFCGMIREERSICARRQDSWHNILWIKRQWSGTYASASIDEIRRRPLVRGVPGDAKGLVAVAHASMILAP